MLNKQAMMTLWRLARLQCVVRGSTGFWIRKCCRTPVLKFIRRNALLRVCWCGAILAVVICSLLPADSLPMVAISRVPVNDKAEHFGAYFVLAILPAIHERWRFVTVAALGAIVLGVGLEFGQNYSPGRSFEILDMLADSLGVCSGLAVGFRLDSPSSGILVAGLKRSRH